MPEPAAAERQGIGRCVSVPASQRGGLAARIGHGDVHRSGRATTRSARMVGCWMDTLPLTGEYTTYALQEANPSLIDYVTDSAASGTGLGTGFKTSNGRISSIAGTGDAVHAALADDSRARAAGRLQHRQRDDRRSSPTPRRRCSTRTSTSAAARVRPTWRTARPSKKDNGGPGSIAEQSVDHHVNVLARRRTRAVRIRLITGGPLVGQDGHSVRAGEGLHGVSNTPRRSTWSAAVTCSGCSTPAT